MSISQSDLVLIKAISDGLAWIRKYPYHLDFALEQVLAENLKTQFGREEIARAKKWFLSTHVPVTGEWRIDKPDYPVISVVVKSSVEAQEKSSLGEVNPQVLGENEVEKSGYIPTPDMILGPFSPGYDPDTGLVTLPDGFSTELIFANQGLYVPQAGETYTITEINSDSTFTIDSGLVLNMTGSYVTPAYNSLKLVKRIANFNEVYEINCIVKGSPGSLYWLHSIVSYILLQRRQYLLEKYNIGLSNISSGEISSNSDDGEMFFQKTITMSGYAEVSWVDSLSEFYEGVSGDVTFSQNPNEEATPPSLPWATGFSTSVAASTGGTPGPEGPAGPTGATGATGPQGAAGPSDVIRESSGPTSLTVGAISDGQILIRSGSYVLGASSVTASTHASTHLPGSTDALAVSVAISLTPGNSSSTGTASSFALSDHVHGLPAFGTTAGTIAQGNDSRFTDSRTPTGTAGGQLSGTYPNPNVIGIRETSGPTSLTIGSIATSTSLMRIGSNIVGVDPWFYIFGDASDGNATITNASTSVGTWLVNGAVSRAVYLNTLTITGSGSINMSGFPLFVQTLDLSGAGANAIHRNGVSGAAGTQSGAAAGAAAALGTAVAGSNGGARATTTGNNGTAIGGFVGNGGAGGRGGSGATGTSGAGGAGGTMGTVTPYSIRRLAFDLIRGAGLLSGGSGGTGGGSGGGQGSASSSGFGGGGGGGGGVVAIYARSVVLSNTTAASAISAKGGDASSAEDLLFALASGGGGGGGGGGWVYVVAGQVTGGPVSGLVNASGGSGAKAGNTQTTGTVGAGGAGGNGGRITILNLSNASITETDATATAGSNGNAGSGTTGGSGGSGASCTASM